MGVTDDDHIEITYISDDILYKICKEAGPLIFTKIKETAEPADYWKAFDAVSVEDSKFVSKARAVYTKFGHALQLIVFRIAQQNNRWTVYGNEKDDGRVVDVLIDADDKTYLLFVQSLDNTKNSSAWYQMKKKMKKKKASDGIVAVVQE